MNHRGSSPLVIGGVGGSGTRVYRALAIAAGYRMPATPGFRRTQEDAHDHWSLRKFWYPKWTDKYLEGDLSHARIIQMRAELRFHLFATAPLTVGRGLWGWKNPTTIYLLPFLAEVYPQMRYIHVVRDGRDHAFHPSFPYVSRQHQLLSADEIDLPDHVRKALMWSRTQELGEQAAHDELEGRYLQSRLEDLCDDPRSEISKIFSFLGNESESAVQDATRLVHRPSSLGRWRSESEQEITEVENAIGGELVRYGYPLISR